MTNRLFQISIGAGAAALLLSAAASAQVNLRAPVYYAVGEFPAGAAAADFDNDGDVDLAVTSESPLGVRFLFNERFGEFVDGGFMSLPAGAGAGQILTADFNADGADDFVVALPGRGSIMIAFNNGDGRFLKKLVYATGKLPHGLAVGDLNNDGLPDIAVANARSNSVTLLYHSRAFVGEFTAETLRAGRVPLHVGIADLNGDQRAEVIVANSEGASIMIFQRNSRFFRNTQTLAVPGGLWPDAMQITDVDQDRDLDIVFAANKNRASMLGVFRNDAGRGFFPHGYKTIGWGTTGLALADLNGDGHLDALTADRASDNLSVMLGRGGVFTQGGRCFVDGLPEDVLAVDLDRDGDMDFVATSSGGKSVAVIFNDWRGRGR
jgi:hypothetical protein